MHDERNVRGAGKHRLKRYAVKERVRRGIADDSVPVRTETLRIPEGEPENGRPSQRHEALHHDGHHVLALHQSAIKKSEPGRHQHDEARAEQHKARISDIYSRRCGSHRRSLRSDTRKKAFGRRLGAPLFFPASPGRRDRCCTIKVVGRHSLKGRAVMHSSFLEPDGQGWSQLAQLGMAFVLSALIGLEREYRQKSAGFRTYTVVGLAAALIMLISKYGFTDVLQADRVVLDPSRVAAQIVTGIGFIGGGVIFMRREIVQGLTTAAIVWLTAGVGMACGAGLPLLAIAVTAGHFIVVFALTPVARQVQRFSRPVVDVRLTYEGGRGTLREALATCTA